MLRSRLGRRSVGGMKSAKPRLFRGRHCEPEIIVTCVRWHLRFSLSLRDVEELMAERGLVVDHTTVWRWCQIYGPVVYRRLKGRTGTWDSTNGPRRSGDGLRVSPRCCVVANHLADRVAVSLHSSLQHLRPPYSIPEVAWHVAHSQRQLGAAEASTLHLGHHRRLSRSQYSLRLSSG